MLGGITIPAQNRDVCQPSAMDNSIVYRPNPTFETIINYYKIIKKGTNMIWFMLKMTMHYIMNHKNVNCQVTFIYIALLTIQIVTKHCTVSK